MMKILIENHGPAEFDYSPAATVEELRKFAAEKLGCKATQLTVRQPPKPGTLANGKTFADLGITENDTLEVSKTKRNLIKVAANKVFAGKSTRSIKHDISQVRMQANKETSTWQSF